MTGGAITVRVVEPLANTVAPAAAPTRVAMVAVVGVGWLTIGTPVGTGTLTGIAAGTTTGGATMGTTAATVAAGALDPAVDEDVATRSEPLATVSEATRADCSEVFARSIQSGRLPLAPVEFTICLTPAAVDAFDADPPAGWAVVPSTCRKPVAE